MRAEGQQVLYVLFREQLLPFALTAYQIQANDRGEYRVHFNDSRIHSCRFAWKEGEDFVAIFRAAILERVNQMSGRLHHVPRLE